MRSSSPQREITSSSASDGKSSSVGNGDSRQDTSPLSHRSVNAASSNYANGLRSKSKSNSKVSEADITVEFSDDDANGQLNGDENADAFEQIQNDFVDGFDTGDNVTTGDQTLPDHAEPDRDNLDMDSPSIIASDSRKSKQTRPAPKTKKATSGDRNRTQRAAQQDTMDGQESRPKRKRPGRPPKSESKANNDDTVDRRPSKKTKTTNQENNLPSNPELDKVVENYVNRTGPLKGRSLYILKREVPSDGTATHTRSGRVSVRPLAYWRNERCVYGDGEAADGQRFPLSTIKEVIRTEELQPEKKKTGKRQFSSKKSKSKKRKEDDSEDEGDEYLDPWEKEGVLHGYVRKWDAETQTGTQEEEVLGMALYFTFIFIRFSKLLTSRCRYRICTFWN